LRVLLKLDHETVLCVLPVHAWRTPALSAHMKWPYTALARALLAGSIPSYCITASLCYTLFNFKPHLDNLHTSCLPRRDAVCICSVCGIACAVVQAHI
jgi:hypothetical protein